MYRPGDTTSKKIELAWEVPVGLVMLFLLPAVQAPRESTPNPANRVTSEFAYVGLILIAGVFFVSVIRNDARSQLAKAGAVGGMFLAVVILAQFMLN